MDLNFPVTWEHEHCISLCCKTCVLRHCSHSIIWSLTPWQLVCIICMCYYVWMHTFWVSKSNSYICWDRKKVFLLVCVGISSFCQENKKTRLWSTSSSTCFISLFLQSCKLCILWKHSYHHGSFMIMDDLCRPALWKLGIYNRK